MNTSSRSTETLVEAGGNSTRAEHLNVGEIPEAMSSSASAFDDMQTIDRVHTANSAASVDSTHSGRQTNPAQILWYGLAAKASVCERQR